MAAGTRRWLRIERPLRRRAAARASCEDPVQQRVERQEDQVVQERRPDEPGDPVDHGAPVQDLPDRPGRDGERRHMSEQVQRTRSVSRAGTSPSRHAEAHRRDPLGAVHARQRRDDDSRGIPVVERQVRAVDAERQQRRGRRRREPRSTTRGETARRSGASAPRAPRRAGAPASRAEVGEPHPGPVLRGGPPLDAGDR